MTEYGRIHTDGSRSGGQPLQSDVERVARALAQADGIEICSDATYALSSYGHKAQAALAALRQPTQSDALRKELATRFYRKSGEFQVGLTVPEATILAAEAFAFLQEQSK